MGSAEALYDKIVELSTKRTQKGGRQPTKSAAKSKAALDMGKGKRTPKKRKTRQKDRDAGRICDLEDKKREKKAVKCPKKNLFVFSQTLLCLKPFEDVQ